MFHESNDNVARVFSMEILANEAQWTFVTTPIYCTPFDPTCLSMTGAIRSYC